jgi:uncharacterized protein
MPSPHFVVPIADLESGEKRRSWDIPLPWLEGALADTEARPRGSAGRVEATLNLNGRSVIVRGRVRASLTVPCARTLDPVDVEIDAELFLMLEPALVPATPPGRPTRRRRPNAKEAPAKDTDVVLSPEDAAKDTYDGEEIVLDPFVREFIVLELPMFPLREDLRSTETPGIPRAPGVADPNEGSTASLDPRLAPLAQIARRLRDKE